MVAVLLKYNSAGFEPEVIIPTVPPFPAGTPEKEILLPLVVQGEEPPDCQVGAALPFDVNVSPTAP